MSITIELPQEILEAAHITVPEIKRELALQLYAQGRLSLGKARELADMSLWQFRHLLATRHIPIDYDAAEVDDEVAALQKLEQL